MRRLHGDTGTMSLRFVLVLGALLAGCTPVAGPTTTIGAAPTILTTTPPTTVTTTTPTTVAASSTTSDPQVAPPGALLVVGDWGTGTLPQGAVAGAMARYAEVHRVTAILTTGDNLYSDDFEFLLEPMDWVFQQGIPFWVTWGDHDVETASRIEIVEQAFASAPRWTVHEWRDVDVVILDSTQVSSEEQIHFLEQTLEESESPTIVVFHHPPLTCGGYQDDEAALDSWVPLFDEDVVMVLGGHDHNYQRFELEGVTYVVSGGGGRPLDELSDCLADHPERVAGDAIHHFLALTQGEGEIAVEVINVTSETVDAFEVALP